MCVICVYACVRHLYQVYVGENTDFKHNVLCGQLQHDWHTKQLGQHRDISCGGKEGRYVHITGHGHVLTLCEVKITGRVVQQAETSAVISSIAAEKCHPEPGFCITAAGHDQNDGEPYPA